MRYILKGGVWKNTEDEILKAAVMKYGLNQWARISSLLVRKSAAQCKARWYEWLDPSIKKTEWTREEEEKLLHLAKMFPCQWRTIAPVIGRTPASCIEQYEKLLDKAQGREPDQNDPRKLRLGEIDPNPETKPARPDQIDMDDDEKEMLQEARARLANIRGKKAKRKAREKQLESARRLSTLQKRREMKAAGIEIFIKQRMIGLDYNAEIPFQRVEPVGRFKPSKEENPTVDKDRVNIAMQQIESSHRASRQKALREKDLKKFNLLKEKNFPAAAQKLKKIRDSQALAEAGPRTELILPQAQIQQKEFTQIQKMSAQATGSSATEALAGNFSIRRSEQWSVNRTPAPPSTLMQEARNALAYTNAPTPLLAGIDENANVQAFRTEEVKEKSVHSELKTPNPLLQSVKVAKEEGLFKAPLPVKKVQGRGQQTDLLNQDVDQAWDELEKQQSSKNSSFSFENVKAELSALPAPKNQFEVNLSSLQEANHKIFEPVSSELLGKEEPISIDQVVTTTLAEQKGLPIAGQSIFTVFENQDEMAPLSQKIAKRIKEIRKVDLATLEEKEDIDGIIWKTMCSEDQNTLSKTKFEEAQRLVQGQIEKSQSSTKALKQPSRLKEEQNLSFAEQIQSLSQAFEVSKSTNKRLLKKIDQLEKKNHNKLESYFQQDLDLREKLSKELKAQEKLKSQNKIYELLERVEEKAGERRINELTKYFKSLEEKEVGLQERYLKLRELLE